MSTKSVLIIDDDRIILRLMETVLQKAGFIVWKARSVDEAWVALEGATPDVICCDLMMPEVTGIDFLRAATRHERFASIPVILVTAAGNPDLIAEALAAGAKEYIPKPFSKQQLLTAVECVAV